MEDEQAPPPAEAPQEDGPLSSRIESKLWKTRMEAYVELAQLVDAAEDCAVADEYAGKLAKMVVDTNVNAQEKGVEAACSCARKMPVDTIAGWAPAVMAKALDKAFGQVKVKAKAQELALLLIEAEQGEMVSPTATVSEVPCVRDIVIEGIIAKGCSHKQPKVLSHVVHAAVECIRMAVQNFGLKALGAQSKAVVKLSVALLEASATAAPVRAEAKLLAVELHRFMGAALRPSYDNLRPAQQQDLDSAFAEAPPPAPTRMTRSAAAARAAAGDSGTDTAVAAAAVEEFDPTEMIEAVDVLGKLPKDFNEKIFTVPKWTEKKEMLDELLKLASSPRVSPGDFGELVKTLKRLTGDSMVVVVATAIQALGTLGKALKRDFSQYAKNSTATLFDRLKEKDKRVVEACHVALDSYLGCCITITEMCDDLAVALGPKGIPKSKGEVLKFLQRAIDSKMATFVPKTHKPVLEAVLKGTEDSAPDIREGSIALLAALVRSCGADAMRAPLASLDEKRRKRVEALAGDEAPAAAPAPTATAARPAPKTAPKRGVKPVATATTSAAYDGPAKISKSGTSIKAKIAEGKEDVEAKEEAGVPTEELDSLAESAIAADVRAKLSSSNWKERLEAMEMLEIESTEKAATMESPMPEVWVRLLAVSFVDRKETNFQVLNKVHGVVASLAEKVPKFTKRAAHWFIPHMVEKLGDVKLKQGAHDALLTVAEAATPQFVLTKGFEAIKKQKAPKTIESAILWVNAMIGDFGLKAIKVKPVLEFVKGMLEHANPGVKKATIEVLVSMRRQLGPDIRRQLEDVKPALLASIDEAFGKVTDEAPVVAPKRAVKAAEGEDAAACGDVTEIVSLAGPISAHIKALGDANWKERQAAIAAIDEIVTKAKPLGCTGPYMEGACGELWGAMKARLKDINKNLAIQVVALLGKIAAAVGAPVEKYAKFVMPNMLALIADNKKQVREAVVACLSAWGERVSIECIVKHIPAALSVESPAGREDSARWLSEYLRARVAPATAVDLSSVLPPVMDSLNHRVTEVRATAEACLTAIIACGGKQLMELHLRDVKPAQLKGLRPLCDKAEKAAAAIASAPLPAADAQAPPTAPEVAMAPKTSDDKAVPAKRAGAVALKEDKAAAEREAAAAAAAAAEEAEKVVLKSNGAKEAREKKRGNRKWVLSDSKEVEELLGEIKGQMAAHVHEDVMANLFHRDFKKQVEGIKELAEFAPGHAQEVTENLDLLLRLCALRLAGKLANTTVVLSILEFLKSLLDLLVAHDYRLSEAEATVLMPCLMEEVGSNSDGVRKHIRELLKKATQVYPASKIFGFAMDTLHCTRNQRSRAENLSEMAALIDRLGLDQVCMPSKALPAIASYVGERDSLVRNAACDCIAAAYGSIGERVWKLLPKLEPKEKDILEARLRKVKPTASEAAPTQDLRKSMPDLSGSVGAAAPSPSASAVRASMPSLDAATLPCTDNILDLLEAPTPSISNIRSRFQAAAAAPTPPPPADARMLMRELAVAAGPEAKVAALKRIGSSIQDEDVAATPWGSEADALVGALHDILASGLDNTKDEAAQRAVKHALHLAHLAFTAREDVARALSEQALGRLMEEVLVRLHEPSLQGDDALEAVMRGMNELVMDLLHRAKPNHVFTVLIRSLYEGAPLSGGREATPELVDGVLRCLLEMTRRMNLYLGALDIDMLLYDAHMFLVAHPPSKYRGKEFRPLRLLKTILNELVKAKGEAIRAHLSLVPVDSKPTICSYIDLVLQQQYATARPSTAGAGGGNIAEIFEKIASKDKDLAKEGFKLLYQHTKANPEFSLQSYLVNRSPQFQEHVHKNLAKVQAQQEAAAAQAAVSAPATDAAAPAASTDAKEPLQDLTSQSNAARAGGAAGAGALLDKLHGIRSQLGISGSRPATASGPVEEAPVPAAAPEADAGAASLSVQRLQERLAKLRP